MKTKAETEMEMETKMETKTKTRTRMMTDRKDTEYCRERDDEATISLRDEVWWTRPPPHVEISAARLSESTLERRHGLVLERWSERVRKVRSGGNRHTDAQTGIDPSESSWRSSHAGKGAALGFPSSFQVEWWAG
jgi:hypothetical protein